MKPLEYFFDTPSSGEGHFAQKFYRFFRAAANILLKLLFRYKVYDIEKITSIPQGTGFIIAGNHRSYFDPILVLCSLKKRPVRFIAKEEFFEVSPLISRAASWVGAFPVKRGSADMQAIKRAVRMLKRGEILGIFPEGHRMRSEEDMPAHHAGVALIAQLANVPVIPVRLWGTERISPKGKRLFRLPKIVLRYGDPISIDEERFAALPKEERTQAFTNEVMERIFSMEPPTAKLAAQSTTEL